MGLDMVLICAYNPGVSVGHQQFPTGRNPGFRGFIMLCSKAWKEVIGGRLREMDSKEAMLYLAFLSGYLRNTDLHKHFERFALFIMIDSDHDTYHGLGEHCCRMNYSPSETCEVLS